MMTLAVALLQSAMCHELAIVPVQSDRSANTREIAAEGDEIYVSNVSLADQRHVVGAYVNVTDGQVVLNVNLDSVGRAALVQFTAKHVGSTIAFLHDGRRVRAARILDPLREGNFLIGPLDAAEAQRLAKEINESVSICTRQALRAESQHPSPTAN
jgi:preprotein translocase subunit SecD